MAQAELARPQQYVDEDMPGSELVSFAGGTVAIYSARCPRKQGPNQDAAALIPVSHASGILIVADGAGGQRAGEQASSLAIEALSRSVRKVARGELELREAVLDGIENANRAISELGIGAATTLAVVEVQNRTIRPYHVGDSMILFVGQRGKIKLQTVCHSPVGYAVESGFLDEAEALHHEERHLISNMIGSPTMHIEVGPTLEMAEHDTLLLASDGLFDNLHVEEIVQQIRKGSLSNVAEELAQHCHQRMTDPKLDEPCKPDDVTFIAFRPTPSARKPRGAPLNSYRRA